MESKTNTHNRMVIEALAYFDIFDFPLTKREIFNYSKFADLSMLEETLSELISMGLVFPIKNYFSIRNEDALAETRDSKVKIAFDYHKQAVLKSNLISQFPFVRGVFISGSYSKGVMDKDGDIDFFIVTKSNRLWVARTLLILYKKIFLLNSRKYFCINYLVDEESLEIQHKNRFTAVELISLLPMVNEDLHQQIIDSNNWVLDYFSGNFHTNPKIVHAKNNKLQQIIEKWLSGSIGNQLDNFFMKITLRRWKQKFGEMNEEDFKVALHTSKKVSKHHPSNFQKKVLFAFNERMNAFEGKLQEAVEPSISRA